MPAHLQLVNQVLKGELVLRMAFAMTYLEISLLFWISPRRRFRKNNRKRKVSCNLSSLTVKMEGNLAQLDDHCHSLESAINLKQKIQISLELVVEQGHKIW